MQYHMHFFSINHTIYGIYNFRTNIKHCSRVLTRSGINNTQTGNTEYKSMERIQNLCYRSKAIRASRRALMADAVELDLSSFLSSPDRLASAPSAGSTLVCEQTKVPTSLDDADVACGQNSQQSSASEVVVPPISASPSRVGVRPGRTLVVKARSEALDALRGGLRGLPCTMRYLQPGWYFLRTRLDPATCAVVGRIRLGSSLQHEGHERPESCIEASMEFAAPVPCSRTPSGNLDYFSDNAFVELLEKECKAEATLTRTFADVSPMERLPHEGPAVRSQSTCFEAWAKRLPRRPRGDKGKLRTSPYPALPPPALTQGAWDGDGARWYVTYF